MNKLSKKDKTVIFLISFVINLIIFSVMFYFLDDNNSCVFNWGTKCSNVFFGKLIFQVVFSSIFFTWFTLYNIKLRNKRNENKKK